MACWYQDQHLRRQNVFCSLSSDRTVFISDPILFARSRSLPRPFGLGPGEYRKGHSSDNRLPFWSRSRRVVERCKLGE
eukprot:3941128-Rhodomonas_salina.8